MQRPNPDNTSATVKVTSPVTAIRCTSVYQNVHVAISDAQRLIRVPGWLSESLRRYFDNTSTILPNAANPLFTLPAELLIHILQYLSAANIASVQTVGPQQASKSGPVVHIANRAHRCVELCATS